MPPTAAPRQFYADWLRIAAFALLVLYHVGMLYVPWSYHVKHDPVYPALEPWMRLTNPWRMSLLFVVSGLATGLMLGRPRLGLLRALLLPRFGESHALWDDWWAHATYGPMFALGVLMARRAALLDRLQALRWPARPDQTIIVGAAVALRPLALPAGLEAALIALLTFAGGLAAWALARQVAVLRPWMGLARAARI